MRTTISEEKRAHKLRCIELLHFRCSLGSDIQHHQMRADELEDGHPSKTEFLSCAKLLRKQISKVTLDNYKEKKQDYMAYCASDNAHFIFEIEKAQTIEINSAEPRFVKPSIPESSGATTGAAESSSVKNGSLSRKKLHEAREIAIDFIAKNSQLRESVLIQKLWKKMNNHSFESSQKRPCRTTIVNWVENGVPKGPLL